jgi:hypothetical protein
MQGKVQNDMAYLTGIGTFDVDVAIEGRVLLVQQVDQPGLIAAVAKVLADDEVNVAYMTVSRVKKGAPQIPALIVLRQFLVSSRVTFREVVLHC